MSKLKEILLDPSQFREGETAKVLPVELTFDDGSTVRGLGKIFSRQDNAQKEVDILRSLETRNLGTASVLDVRPLSDFTSQEGILVVETPVLGETLAEIGPPQPLSEVQTASRLIFDQLEAIGSNEDLIAKDEGYCGDISTANVIDSPMGFSIVDWSGKFGLSGEDPELTQGFIAPEIFSERGEGLRFVLADTFSLGTLLARAVMGRDKFRDLVPREPESAHLRFNQIVELVPPSVHAFFKIALAEDPRERSPKGAINASEHYKRLKSLFLGEQ